MPFNSNMKPNTRQINQSGCSAQRQIGNGSQASEPSQGAGALSPRGQSRPLWRILIVAATAVVTISHRADVPTAANDDHPPKPPRSPGSMSRTLPAPANDNTQAAAVRQGSRLKHVRQASRQVALFGGPTELSGRGHANFMNGVLPASASMTWVRTIQGERFLASKQSAPHLEGFVNDLEAAGAPIKAIGGYNPRRIAGSSRWSQHAYGNAIDIDQLGRNRVAVTFGVWAWEHSDIIRASARKHGIISGGDWRKNADFGHFEWGGGAEGAASKSLRGPASTRFNNPGAQYPANWAKTFGMDGVGVVGGGHLIAHFSDAVGGAAANMYLLQKSYVGMTVGAAGTKWTGGNGFGVPGYDPDKLLTNELLSDPDFLIPFLKAIARREAGRGFPLTDDQWMLAFLASKGRGSIHECRLSRRAGPDPSRRKPSSTAF